VYQPVFSRHAKQVQLKEDISDWIQGCRQVHANEATRSRLALTSELIIEAKIHSDMKKDYPERLPLSEVWHHFQAGGFAHFSTLDGDQPRVRMMALTAHDQRLWLVTRSSDDKVVQISKNPQAEFTYAIPGTERTGCLRATVEAFIEENQAYEMMLHQRFLGSPTTGNLLKTLTSP